MRSEEYRRIHDICLDMAQQCDSEDLHDRWLKLAEYWLDRAGQADVIEARRKKCVKSRQTCGDIGFIRFVNDSLIILWHTRCAYRGVDDAGDGQ